MGLGIQRHGPRAALCRHIVHGFVLAVHLFHDAQCSVAAIGAEGQAGSGIIGCGIGTRTGPIAGVAITFSVGMSTTAIILFEHTENSF